MVGEHLEMSLALSAMQGSLEGAVEAVESCKKQPKEARAEPGRAGSWELGAGSWELGWEGLGGMGGGGG